MSCGSRSCFLLWSCPESLFPPFLPTKCTQSQMHDVVVEAFTTYPFYSIFHSFPVVRPHLFKTWSPSWWKACGLIFFSFLLFPASRFFAWPRFSEKVDVLFCETPVEKRSSPPPQLAFRPASLTKSCRQSFPPHLSPDPSLERVATACLQRHANSGMTTFSLPRVRLTSIRRVLVFLPFERLLCCTVFLFRH